MIYQIENDVSESEALSDQQASVLIGIANGVQSLADGSLIKK